MQPVKKLGHGYSPFSTAFQKRFRHGFRHPETFFFFISILYYATVLIPGNAFFLFKIYLIFFPLHFVMQHVFLIDSSIMIFSWLFNFIILTVKYCFCFLLHLSSTYCKKISTARTYFFLIFIPYHLRISQNFCHLLSTYCTCK